MKKNILVVGGNAGVGLKLAEHYVGEGHNVCITGGKPSNIVDCYFHPLAITDQAHSLPRDLDGLSQAFTAVNTVVYTVNYVKKDHSDGALQAMVNNTLLAPMMLVQRLKKNASGPLKVMLVTPDLEREPWVSEAAYCATKAGLEMFGASLVRDSGIGKVLVVSPAGTEAVWTADQIVSLSGGAFKYKYARLSGTPNRVEVLECKDNDLKSI